MTSDEEELRAALRADARLSPDLNAVRRTVLENRGRRRDRHRWWATALVAGCVLMISSAVAMSAIGVDEQRAGRDAVAPVTVAPFTVAPVTTAPITSTPHSTAGPLPSTAATVTPARSRPPTTARTPGSSARTAATTAPASPVSSPARPRADPAVKPDPRVDADTTPLEFPVAGDQLTLTGGAVAAARHCQSQVIAWPLVLGGRVDESALRSAVNECAVAFGERAAVLTRYTLVRMAAVSSGTGLWRDTDWGAAQPDRKELDRPILVVRLQGHFPALADDGGAGPTAVQIYVDAGSKYWAGMQVLAPVDPATLGGVITVLSR